MVLISHDIIIRNLTVRFTKPHISVISADLWRNMLVLINLDFIIGNLTVRFAIPVFSVIFKKRAVNENVHLTENLNVKNIMSISIDNLS